ncbi:MAG: peptidoglycan editing factor PgeF [Oscillatoriales cyanobacterium SM2_2_1]|nr:peptidoglycan editing factor PgeF [Oscillatoriales cyanobacterium SM2_2_1]
MNAQWYWHDHVLTCSLLDGFSHGFFTRAQAPQVPEQLHRQYFGAGTAYSVKQVHGDRLWDTQPRDPLPEADALFTDEPLASTWICSADCVPILIGDRQSGRVAAIHAGWRGTAANIIPQTLTHLCATGSQPEHLMIALGPAISGMVYQVKTSVAEAVLATIEHTVGILVDPDPERVRLDLRQVQHQQLQEWGIGKHQIATAPHCTLREPERFFSYRRVCLESSTPPAKAPAIQWSGIQHPPQPPI